MEVAFSRRCSARISVPHLHTQFGVKVGERFIEQEQFRVAHHRPAHGDTLPLAARKLRRPSRRERVEVQQGGGGGHAQPDRLGRHAAKAQAEGHILLNRHVRIERVALEYHRDVPVHGRHVVDPKAVNQDVAARCLLKTGDHAQQRGLATAGWSDEGDELVLRNIKIKLRDDLQCPEALLNAPERHRRHWSSPPL